jgi:hypothetical protein
VAGDRRYGLTVITHPDAAGVLSPRGPGDRWSYNREWQPGRARLVDLAGDELARLIATAAGIPALRPRIEDVSAFSFAAQLADRYRVGRAFLVGDAAHRMTPRGGTGMNSGIQDGHDLGWKLAWVLRGWADPALLDSYPAERRPVGAHNVARSADPGGARRDADEALRWDLDGRVAHRWVAPGGSTLDLLGDWLTLMYAEGTGWDGVAPGLAARAPVTSAPLDRPVADAVGVPPGGALLLRPDGRVAAHWQAPARATVPARTPARPATRRPRSAEGELAAVHGERPPGDPGRPRRDQEPDQLGHVLRSPDPPQRDPGGYGGGYLGRVGTPGQPLPDQVRAG